MKIPSHRCSTHLPDCVGQFVEISGAGLHTRLHLNISAIPQFPLIPPPQPFNATLNSLAGDLSFDCSSFVSDAFAGL